MHYNPALRRTQFSSCDACRQSRVACDASKIGYRPGDSRWGGSCSRCALRNRHCTFEWIKKTPARLRQDSSFHPASRHGGPFGFSGSPDHAALTDGPEPEAYSSATLRHPPRVPSCELLDVDELLDVEAALDSVDAVSLDAESTDLLLTQCSDFVFRHGIGPIFGRWVGKNGCPFVDEPASDVCIPPTKLFAELDAGVDEQLDRDSGDAFSTPARREQRDHQIEQSLRRAMHSYAAQWLPILMQGNPAAARQYEQVIRDSWRATRRDMLRVIHRASYRSVLTLYLFGQTPVPMGISNEEEQDGLSCVICIQTALMQVQQLQERLRSYQFNGSEVSAWSDSVTGSIPSPNLSPEYLSLESRAYWATVTWDTSSAMTLNFRSSLSSGLKGACLETSWRLARGFLVGSFLARTEDWRKKGFEVSDEVAPQIISAVAVCRIYTWRTIASLKEALREGVEEDVVLGAWDALLDALDIFKTTIQPLLNNCERQLHFLGQVNRLYWYEMVLHYHLGILILVDALETANRSDLLSQLTDTRLEAEHECFNVLKFGLDSKYTVDGPRPNPDDASTAAAAAAAPEARQSTTTSFVAMDPYPHHVVAAVRLMNRAISRKYRRGNVMYQTYAHLSSTLLEALQQLPQGSKTVRSARENLQSSLYRLDAISADGSERVRQQP